MPELDPLSLESGSDGALAKVAWLLKESQEYEQGLAAALKTELDNVRTGKKPTLSIQDRNDIVDEINNEAGGAASLSKAGEEGKVRIELKTPVGAVTIFVPSAALSGDAIGGQGSAISLDQFLKALVDGAMSKYDTDKNGTLESDEFVSFAAANPFLTAWFGRLASKRSKGSGQSWKDVDP
jgi:hypothetical protein